jgi:hypothetical protein
VNFVVPQSSGTTVSLFPSLVGPISMVSSEGSDLIVSVLPLLPVFKQQLCPSLAHMSFQAVSQQIQKYCASHVQQLRVAFPYQPGPQFLMIIATTGWLRLRELPEEAGQRQVRVIRPFPERELTYKLSRGSNSFGFRRKPVPLPHRRMNLEIPG